MVPVILSIPLALSDTDVCLVPRVPLVQAPLAELLALVAMAELRRVTAPMAEQNTSVPMTEPN